MKATRTLGAEAWASELPRLLVAHGPLAADLIAERLRAAGHAVTGDEVTARLISRRDAYETQDGWVSLFAHAEGSVLTTVLTDEGRACGVLWSDGDLDLWERLAATRRIPLAAGGELRAVVCSGPAEAAWRNPVGLSGPAGWLAGFHPGQIIGLRLRGGAIELAAADDLLDGENHGTEKFGTRLQALVESCLPLCHCALDRYAYEAHEARRELFGVQPGVSLSQVIIDLIAARPGVLCEPFPPLPPLSTLLPALGFEVQFALVGLPGTFWHPDEADDLEPREIIGSVLATTWLRRADRGDRPAGWCQDFWELTQFGPGVIGRIEDMVQRCRVSREVISELRKSARGPEQRAMAALLAASNGDGGAGRTPDQARHLTRPDT